MPITNSTDFNSGYCSPPAADPTQGVASAWSGHGFDFTQIDSRLEAINLCLASMGRSGVANADSNNVDAKMASREVDRVSYQTQHKGGAGWWFNRENEWVIHPDVNGEIVMPNNCLTVLAARRGLKPVRGYTLRGLKIYDTVAHSFDLRTRLDTDPLHLDLVLQLPYEDLPPSAKMFIAYRAAYNFSGQQEFDANRLSILQRTMEEAQMDMEAEENSQVSNNYWEQSGTMNLFANMAAQGDTSYFFK